jgi:hypothetical protein
MKHSLPIFFALIIFLMGSMACKTDDNMIPGDEEEAINNSGPADSTGTRLRIRIGSKIFTATLLYNPTVTAFKERLPITLNMSELNGNEKLYNFSESLPASASSPRTIRTGDLMLYGSGTLVLFYENFSTPYPYTRLGRIDHANGLAEAVGTGNVTVMFELE